MPKRTLSLICVFSLFIALLPSIASASLELEPPSDVQAESMMLYQQSITLYEAEEYFEALGPITHAIIVWPIQMMFRFQRAKIALAVDDLETAQQDVNIALAFLPENKEYEAFALEVQTARTGIGSNPRSPSEDIDPERALDTVAALAGKGDLDGALAELDKAIAVNPENPTLYETRAILRIQNSIDMAKALTDMSYVLRFSEMYSDDLGKYAGALLRLKRYDEALFFWDLTIDSDPSDPRAYHGRANTYYRQEEYEASLEDFTKSVELDPEQPVFVFERGDAYYQLARYEEALADYTQASRLDPEYHAYYVEYIVMAMSAMLAEQAGQGTYDPPKAQLDMLARFSDLCQEAGITNDPVAEYAVNSNGLPQYPITDRTRLFLFSSQVPDMETVYLLAFDDIATYELDAFVNTWQAFVRALFPDIPDMPAVSMEGMARMLGLSSLEPYAQQTEFASSYFMEGWKFDRVDFDGSTLLIAYHMPQYTAEMISTAMDAHTYTKDSLQATLERFVAYAAEEKLAELNPGADISTDTSEDGWSILWREIAPGMLWGEQYSETDGSFHAFRLMLETSAWMPDAEKWTALAMSAVTEGMPLLYAIEYSSYLFKAPSPSDENAAEVSRITIDGRAFSVSTEDDRFTLYITGNVPDEPPGA